MHSAPAQNAPVAIHVLALPAPAVACAALNDERGGCVSPLSF